MVFVGLLDNLYLLYSHYRNYTDIAYSSFCAISKSLNCDTVAQSPWSVVWGIPLALWGIVGYLFFLIILLSARKKNDQQFHVWNILFITAIFFSISSVILGYISASKIHSYCLMCLANYGINFFLLVYSWITSRRFVKESFIVSIILAVNFVVKDFFQKCLITILFVFVIAVKLFLPNYWVYDFTDLSSNIDTGITSEGHPWIGARKPLIEIEEFSDYQCFQCYKMHYVLRRLVVEHPYTIRLIHRHYPLDHLFNPVVVPETYHVGSGKMALLAIYATLQDKFWPMNDALFSLGRYKKPFNTKQLALKTGLTSGELVAALAVDSESTVYQILTRDIWQGMKLRISATPTFVINGTAYQGGVPAEVFKELLQLVDEQHK